MDNVEVVIYTNGHKEFWVNGKLHRLDGPAVEYTNGNKEYWVNGLRHRLDGPAVEYVNGYEYWVNGKLHSLDGPAVKSVDGQEYWVDGLRHRFDGPAFEFNGDKEYWINGILQKREIEGDIITYQYLGKDSHDSQFYFSSDQQIVAYAQNFVREVFPNWKNRDEVLKLITALVS